MVAWGTNAFSFSERDKIFLNAVAQTIRFLLLWLLELELNALTERLNEQNLDFYESQWIYKLDAQINIAKGILPKYK